MTAAGEILRDEIRRGGPVTFERFMDVALYHPECGYYRRPHHDPFGKQGDFFTAEQMQPSFGILMAQRVRLLRDELGAPEDFRVVELGAGRAEMAEWFGEFGYTPVEIGAGELPASFTGVVFSNEFFDALPVHVVSRREGELREQFVTLRDDGFAWFNGELARPEIAAYVERYLAPLEEGWVCEVNLRALEWMERLAASLQRGYVLSVDYGYTRREAVRFPAGTLMGYHRHAAIDDVLVNPGERDITAHVNFTALSEYGAARGLRTVKLENLSQTLLHAGERDQFSAALAVEDGEVAAMQRRLQLKTLLFGMGETFRTLLQVAQK